MFDTSCYPASVVLIIWIICIIIGTSLSVIWTTRNMFPLVIFLFILQTVILFGFHKLTRFFCKEGYRVISWLMILSPVVVYPILVSLFGVLGSIWFHIFGGPTLVEENEKNKYKI